MRQRCMTTVLLIALVAGLATLGIAQEWLPKPQVQMENGIRYVSGGVGVSSRDTLQQMADDYNLKLVFAVQQGNYLADVPVVIRDRQGNIMLDVVAQGPWLFVDMPAGNYIVTATAYNQIRQRMIRVSEQGQSELHFAGTPRLRQMVSAPNSPDHVRSTEYPYRASLAQKKGSFAHT